MGDDDESYTLRMEVDLVEVEVEGPSATAAKTLFDEVVDDAFERYDEYVTGDRR